MNERSAIIEIEKRDGEYRIELRDRGSGETIGRWSVEGATASGMPYKHVCKLRLPEGEPTVEVDDAGGRIVLRTDGRTCYRHELPAPVAIAH